MVLLMVMKMILLSNKDALDSEEEMADMVNEEETADGNEDGLTDGYEDSVTDVNEDCKEL